MKSFVRGVIMVLVLSASIAEAGGWGGWGRGRDDRGRGGGHHGRGAGWVTVDEPGFPDNKTSEAIKKCKVARAQDYRCKDRDYSCSECSEIDHSDFSSYLVERYQTRRSERNYIRTYKFDDRKTAIAVQKCQTFRNRMRECSDLNRYECTPCSNVEHSDTSSFDLYSIR